MIYVYACADRPLADSIRKDLMKLSVRYPEADYEYWDSSALDEWERRLTETSLADVMICELKTEADADVLKKVRACHKNAKIVPVTDAAIPPTAYVTPEIMPFTLVWRPVDEAALYLTVETVIKSFMKAQPERCFVLETRWDVKRIPYDKILYFEAREKKVFLRLADMELPVNITLNSLAEKLPAQFVRCHKSILVNITQIERMDGTLNQLVLPDGICLPVSRKLKSAVREEMERHAG